MRVVQSNMWAATPQPKTLCGTRKQVLPGPHGKAQLSTGQVHVKVRVPVHGSAATEPYSAWMALGCARKTECNVKHAEHLHTIFNTQSW